MTTECPFLGTYLIKITGGYQLRTGILKRQADGYLCPCSNLGYCSERTDWKKCPDIKKIEKEKLENYFVWQNNRNIPFFVWYRRKIGIDEKWHCELRKLFFDPDCGIFVKDDGEPPQCPISTQEYCPYSPERTIFCEKWHDPILIKDLLFLIKEGACVILKRRKITLKKLLKKNFFVQIEKTPFERVFERMFLFLNKAIKRTKKIFLTS